MDILEMARRVEDSLDRDELERLLGALRVGWKRVCPGEAMHVLLLPEKDMESEAWLFRKIYEIVQEYRTR